MSRVLSPDEQEARYTWLTPAQAALAIGASGVGYVRSLLRDGKLGHPGEIMDIGRGKTPLYRIHPRAVERYRRESVARYQGRVEERAG